MSNIDKQAVQAVADLKAGYTLGHADVAILNELARIAMASLEAEPVAWTSEETLAEVFCDETGVIGPRYMVGNVPLYRHAQHAPVVPDEMPVHTGPREFGRPQAYVDGWNACLAAMLQGADGNSPVIPDCSCGTCRPVTFTDSRFVVCSECGNKRCPHANDHRNACTGSNEPGQEGSAYPAAPQQEAE